MWVGENAFVSLWESAHKTTFEILTELILTLVSPQTDLSLASQPLLLTSQILVHSPALDHSPLFDALLSQHDAPRVFFPNLKSFFVVPQFRPSLAILSLIPTLLPPCSQ